LNEWIVVPLRLIVDKEKEAIYNQLNLKEFVDRLIDLWHNPLNNLKALMETSKPISTVSESGRCGSRTR